jgi:hypothetical protein
MIRAYLDTWESFLQDRQELVDHLRAAHNAAPPAPRPIRPASTDSIGRRTAATWASFLGAHLIQI